MLWDFSVFYNILYRPIYYFQTKYERAFGNYLKCYEISRITKGENSNEAAHYLLLCATAKSYNIDFKESV